MLPTGIRTDTLSVDAVIMLTAEKNMFQEFLIDSLITCFLVWIIPKLDVQIILFLIEFNVWNQPADNRVHIFFAEIWRIYQLKIITVF